MARTAEETRVLSKFMDVRFDVDRKQVLKKRLPAPLITIARDKGCHVTPIAHDLIEELNSRNSPALRRPKWELISKQILEAGARRLQLKPDKIEELLNPREQGIIDDILTSLRGEYYPSEKKIMNVLREVVLSLAKPGYLVVLGRGAVGMTRKFQNALHIHITAPLEWRIHELQRNYKWDEDQARKYILKIDEKRNFVRKYFLGPDQRDHPFDITFNLESMSGDEIVKTVSELIELRKLPL